MTSGEKDNKCGKTPDATKSPPDPTDAKSTKTATASAAKGKFQQTTALAGQNAKLFLAKASGFIENSSKVKQLAIGAAGGWATGFVTHRVGKTAGLTVGGTILLIVAAEHTGIIHINWPKVEKNVNKLSGKAESIGPNMQFIKKYARNNTYFAAGFLGGFLIGVCT